MPLQRIYLDQWAWINLSKAVFREPGHTSVDADAWTVARASVAIGLASFPLSVVHYMETIRDADLNRRRRRGAIMGSLSQFHTIAPPGAILPMEIDHALKATFGRPQQPREVEVFGRGFRHAFGMAADALRFPEGITLPQQRTVEEQLEVALLIGWPMDQDIWKFAQQPDQFGTAFAEREEELGERLASFDFNKGNRLKRAILTDAISEILNEINEGFERAWVSQDEFWALGQRGMTAFFRKIHTRHVVSELRRFKHKQPSQRWDRNDMRDLAAMSLAVVYCDVVVAEKRWTEAIKQTGLDEVYGTTVIDNLTKLPEVLVVATAA